MVLTALLDGLQKYENGRFAMPASADQLVTWILFGIILLNVLAGILYHMISDRTAMDRKLRKARAAIAALEQDAMIEHESSCSTPCQRSPMW